MSREDRRGPRPASPVAAVGIDHVRLAYHYLDTGDIDAYGSLLAEHALMYQPESPPCHGRAEILRLQASSPGPPAGHQIYKIFAADDAVAVTGRRTPRPGHDGVDRAGVDFADIFTLTDEGLLLACRRYYYVAPPSYGANED